MIVAVNKDEITADVAARLVAAQFPQWAGLPVTPVALNGYDNTTFRLGNELSLRFPRARRVPQAVVGVPLDRGRARERGPGRRPGRVRLRPCGLPGRAACHRRQRRA